MVAACLACASIGPAIGSGGSPGIDALTVSFVHAHPRLISPDEAARIKLILENGSLSPRAVEEQVEQNLTVRAAKAYRTWIAQHR